MTAEQIVRTASTLHKIEHGGDPRLSVIRRVLAWLNTEETVMSTALTVLMSHTWWHDRNACECGETPADEGAHANVNPTDWHARHVATLLDARDPLGDGERAIEIRPLTEAERTALLDWAHSDVDDDAEWLGALYFIVAMIRAEAVAAARDPLGEAAAVERISVRRPQIHTGPRNMTVDEASAMYLRDAAARVRAQCYWGSGVTALVADLLDDASAALAPEQPETGAP